MAGAGPWYPLVSNPAGFPAAQRELKQSASWSGLTLSTEGNVPFLSVCLGSGTQPFSPHVRLLLQQGIRAPCPLGDGV